MNRSVGDVRLAGQKRLQEVAGKQARLGVSTIFGGQERLVLGGELRNAVGRAFDSQFFHPVSQGVRMQAKSFSCTARALDHTVSFL